MMAQSDRLLEDIYDLVRRAGSEREATEAARIGKLAIEYRLNQLRQARLQAAIDKRAAERRALKAASIHHDDGGTHTSTPGAVLQRAGAGEGEA